MKKFIACAAALLTVVSTGGLSFTSLAAGSPLVTENFEGATGKFVLVRDKDSIPDTLEGAKNFAFPFEGGDKLLKVAGKDESASASYVIEGNKSVYFINSGADAANGFAPLITKGNLGTPLNFSSDSVYIARFLFKEIATLPSNSSLVVTVRTWSYSDTWVDFTISPKSSGGFSAKVTSGGRTYDKIAVQQVGKDLYEVALRFSGIQPTSGDYCYLMWSLSGQGGISMDDFKLYADKSTPSSVFEKTAYQSGTPSEPEASDKNVSAVKTAPVSKDTSKGNKDSSVGSAETTATVADSESSVTGNAAEMTDTVKTSSVQTITGSQVEADATVSDGEEGGLSGLAVIMLVFCIVVVIGCAAIVAVILLQKKNKPETNDKE